MIRTTRTPKQGVRKKIYKQKANNFFFLEKQFWGEMAMFAKYIVCKIHCTVHTAGEIRM
jgi:hypothetical protein